ncbi:proteasome activator pa28 [Tribonema minus]|uniref:Proteasome activator pa28 n=1 Tax=Tribonema minus TaxID=303371 RepID=A0A835YYY9_9STRA|nr:proteasome activator pa28 [Tribonema minus]
MEALKEQSKSEGEAAREVVPTFVAHLNESLASNFAYTDLSQIESSFTAAVAAAGSVPATNDKLAKLLPAVQSDLATSINILLALYRWIQVHVPIIEDGNNFGVGVQQEVAKLIAESVTKLEAAFDKLPEYHEKRAGAWEKLAAKEDSTAKKSTSKSTVTGGKEGDENKTTVTESNDTSSSTSRQIPDGLRALVTMDVRCYVQLHKSIQLARDTVLFCADMVEKNVTKIKAPKGDAGRHGAPGFMF